MHRLRVAVRASSGPPITPQRTAADLGVTPRELVVLALASEGLTAVAAARRLGISLHTVNEHLDNLHRKLGTTDRVTTVLD